MRRRAQKKRHKLANTLFPTNFNTRCIPLIQNLVTWYGYLCYSLTDSSPSLFFIISGRMKEQRLRCVSLFVFISRTTQEKSFLLKIISMAWQEKYERISLTLPFWFSYCSTCLISKEEEEASSLFHTFAHIHITINDGWFFFFRCHLLPHRLWSWSWKKSRKKQKSNSLNFRSGINSRKKIFNGTIRSHVFLPVPCVASFFRDVGKTEVVKKYNSSRVCMLSNNRIIQLERSDIQI